MDISGSLISEYMGDFNFWIIYGLMVHVLVHSLSFVQ